MRSNRIFRILFFSIALVMSMAVFFITTAIHHQQCMGVKVIGEADLADYERSLTVDLSTLTFCGEPVAADNGLNTIYLSQPEKNMAHFSRLMGKLASTNGHQLFWIQTDALNNLPAAVANGTTLRLAVVNGNNYAEVQVVLSTLPVLRLESQEDAGSTFSGFSITGGKTTLFAGYDLSTGALSVRSYSATWHKRGVYSASLDKYPLKLALKAGDGSNLDANLLGMGADDDWILNSMRIDDTKMREKIIMDSWNQYVATPQLRMSTGEYVEVVMDNRYCGLYLLQRRVDAKYLQLDRTKDILFKGFNTWSAESYQEAYEIVDTPTWREASYIILADVLDHNRYDLENYADVNVLIHFLRAEDNVSYKNMFYLLRQTEDGYRMQLIPWDTDCSMGLTFVPDVGIETDFQYTLDTDKFRNDYSRLTEIYPQLPQICAQRWKALRSTMYDPDRLEAMIRSYQALLESSGAYQRDIQRWGLWSENDTWDMLIRWCNRRIERLDEYYK